MERKQIVVRPCNWSHLDNILDRLSQAGINYGLLGFGCIEMSKAGTDFLNKEGYKIEQVDFERVLSDEKEQEKYVIQRNSYYGLGI